MIFVEYIFAGMITNLIIPYIGFIIVEKCDNKEAPQLTDDILINVIFMAAISSCCGAVILSADDRYAAFKMYDCLLLGAMSGCMLFACVTDILTNKVYDFIWWAAAVVEIAAYILHPISLWKLVCLAVFFIMQELLFAKLYGRADCHAFCICAVMESIFDMDIIGFFLHMILSFAFLIAVQYFRENIGKNGRLKIPVPFMPYITFAFWFDLLINNFKLVRIY